MNEFDRTLQLSSAYGHAVGCMEVLAAALKYDDAYLRSCVERMIEQVREKNINLYKNEDERTLVHKKRDSLPHATD